MTLTDLHTHTQFSADGRGEIREMIHRAIECGLTWYGISEHVNYDYDDLGLKIDGAPIAPIDLPAYFSTARALQKEYADRIRILVGCELGFRDSTFCNTRYRALIRLYRPDFIINSIHTCLGAECYFPEYTADKEKSFAYSEYFRAVLQSLDAPYDYDIVAHIGYCSRNAIYADPKIRYVEYADVLDKILRKIIEKNKILEVNTSSKTAGSCFLPDVDVLARYYELGGRKVSYGSDAHAPDQKEEKRDTVIAALKQIGFTHLTIPCRGEHLQIDF